MYNIDGQEYPTIEALAKAYNLHSGTMTKRLSSGASVKQAVQPVVHSRDTKPKLTTYNNKPYKSKSSFCKALGIKRTTLNLYLDRGTPFEEAVALLLNQEKQPKFNVVLDGVEYKSAYSVAKAYKINSYTVSKLYRSATLTLDNIALVKQRNEFGHNAKVVTYDGKDYLSYKKLADAFGLTYYILMNRLREGWTLAEALNTKSVK